MPAATRLALTLALSIFIAGCSSHPPAPVDYRIWNPSPEQVERAVAVGREYARGILHVDEEALARTKSAARGSYENGRRVIKLQFQDPQVDPEWSGDPKMGGFPTYFRLTVDPESMQVTRHYASRE